MFKIEIPTDAYNQKRYSRPWIANVDFSKDPNGVFNFGGWVGDCQNGSSGLLVIQADIGDIVATGQKDFRKPINSSPQWHYVSNTGDLVPLDGRVAAYKYSCGVKDDQTI